MNTGRPLRTVIPLLPRRCSVEGFLDQEMPSRKNLTVSLCSIPQAERLNRTTSLVLKSHSQIRSIPRLQCRSLWARSPRHPFQPIRCLRPIGQFRSTAVLETGVRSRPTTPRVPGGRSCARCKSTKSWLPSIRHRVWERCRRPEPDGIFRVPSLILGDRLDYAAFSAQKPGNHPALQNRRVSSAFPNATARNANQPVPPTEPGPLLGIFSGEPTSRSPFPSSVWGVPDSSDGSADGNWFTRLAGTPSQTSQSPAQLDDILRRIDSDGMPRSWFAQRQS
jgi:hypothetical protein